MGIVEEFFATKYSCSNNSLPLNTVAVIKIDLHTVLRLKLVYTNSKGSNLFAAKSKKKNLSIGVQYFTPAPN